MIKGGGENCGVGGPGREQPEETHKAKAGSCPSCSSLKTGHYLEFWGLCKTGLQ